MHYADTESFCKGCILMIYRRTWEGAAHSWGIIIAYFNSASLLLTVEDQALKQLSVLIFWVHLFFFIPFDSFNPFFHPSLLCLWNKLAIYLFLSHCSIASSMCCNCLGIISKSNISLSNIRLNRWANLSPMGEKKTLFWLFWGLWCSQVHLFM